MAHNLIRATILPAIVTQIQAEYKIDENEALGMFYTSEVGKLFSEDESGLYGQSPNYIFSLFRESMTVQKDNNRFKTMH